MFKLYGSAESGHAFKVRLMLEVAALPYEYEEVDLRLDRAARPEPFRSLARYGEVPLLVHDGQPYVQSNAILLFLAQHTKAFGGETAERLARCREWLFWEANRIGTSLPHLRFGQRFDRQAYPPGVLDWMRTRFDADIARLNEELSDGRSFLLGDAPTVADFSTCGYMFWPEQAQVGYPAHVGAWLERIRALPGWRHPYKMAGVVPF
ncbi:glutathione S-transferase family protein [Pseudoduganella eburnea]|uniref:Glutathione S-transferase family protein n=1 Tax=Massilia eburnea TaxID=1776165 RepID=A0A6L6QH74_9BURK|nr:glutathione S-transferase family protein [Massilia eburnea]MTW11491.1 glutathione S-transferase family protein [Massilia eburnea]